MASISREPNGRRRILFVAADGKRRTIRLGKTDQRTAESVARHVDALLSSKRANQPIPQQTAAWLAEIGADLYAKLAKAELVAPRDAKPTATLAAFIDDYLAKRTDIKPHTRTNLKQAWGWLVRYFGADKPLADVNEGNAEEFRLFLRERLGENSIRRHCGRARQLFRAAVKRRLIPSNPFGEMKGIAVQANEERFYFVTREEAQKVLDACPDAQWRLLFALSRFGGLRCPSEHLALTWADVDWEHGRIRVRSPKTERHEGKDSRFVPMFPELRRHLEEVWEQAEPGTEFAITRYRDCNANLRTQLQRIIGRAGLAAWPKLFQNLRSTRETELAELFPIHVVCKWIGNSQAVARQHYLQVTDEHFDRAIHDGREAAQNPAQQASEMARTASQAPEGDNAVVLSTREFATSCRIVQECSVSRRGIEPRSDA